MACLNNISSSQLLACGPAPAGYLGRPVSAKLLNASDVVSYAITGGNAVITRKAGSAGAYNLECANGATTVTIGTKGGEVAPLAADVTITTTLFQDSVRTGSSMAISTGGGNTQVLIAVDHGGGVYRVYGLGSPLECLSIEGDTNGNGFARTTFGVADWQSGTTVISMLEADYIALSTAVPREAGGDLDENPLG